MKLLATFAIGLIFLVSDACAQQTNWPGYRGPNGDGISSDTKVPLTWSETENLKWKTPLPGAGSSSPIVLGQHVYVTCYSGYGVAGSDSGNLEDLQRHLVCIDRQNGKLIWSKAVKAEMPEDPYRGFISEHGYASSTPVTDGERIYVFFGKSGVLAFDLNGQTLWKVDVGHGSSRMRWGSAVSPVLTGNLVIVNAIEESETIYALDKLTGKEVWKTEAPGYQPVYGTPLLVRTGDQQHLVIAVPDEVWSLNPDNGKMQWYAESPSGGNVCPCPIYKDGIIYTYGGIRGAGSMAVRVGDKGDVTSSNVVWTSQTSSYVATPLLVDGHLYWIDDRGTAYCQDAATGEVVYRERVSGLSGGRPFYASPILVAGKLYVPSRRDGTFVLPAEPTFRTLAQNKFSSDTTDFNNSPAISDGQMFLRSNLALYCIEAQ